MRGAISLAVLALLASENPVPAQSLRTFMVEMDQRLAAIERRIDALEQDRQDRAGSQQTERITSEKAASADLAASCAAFRNSPAAIKLFNDCAERRRTSKEPVPGCMTVELDELSCHGSR